MESTVLTQRGLSVHLETQYDADFQEVEVIVSFPDYEFSNDVDINVVAADQEEVREAITRGIARDLTEICSLIHKKVEITLLTSDWSFVELREWITDEEEEATHSEEAEDWSTGEEDRPIIEDLILAGGVGLAEPADDTLADRIELAIIAAVKELFETAEESDFS